VSLYVVINIPLQVTTYRVKKNETQLTIYLVSDATIPQMPYFRLPFGRDFGAFT